MNPVLDGALKAWNSKHKLKIVFGLLLLILFFWFLGRTASTLISTEKVPLGSIVAVKCKGCGYTGEMRLLDINDSSAKCPKCSGKLGYRQKCLACGFEFSYLPPNDVNAYLGKDKNEIIVLMAQHKACPNCGSPRTARMSPESK